MTDTLREFSKAAPVGFEFSEHCALSHDYKYFISGKGSTLGVLFEDSINIYFEWLMEDDELVPYPAHIRYKAWPKRDIARLMVAGIWEPRCMP